MSDKISDQAWSAEPHITLCNELAEHGIAIAAVNGICPVHNSDACLYMYVQLISARRQVKILQQQGESSDS